MEDFEMQNNTTLNLKKKAKRLNSTTPRFCSKKVNKKELNNNVVINNFFNITSKAKVININQNMIMKCIITDKPIKLHSKPNSQKRQLPIISNEIKNKKSTEKFQSLKSTQESFYPSNNNIKKTCNNFRNLKTGINKYVTEEHTKNKKNNNKVNKSIKSENKKINRFYNISSNIIKDKKRGNSSREFKVQKKKYKLKNTNKILYNKSVNNIKKPFKIVKNSIENLNVNNNVINIRNAVIVGDFLNENKENNNTIDNNFIITNYNKLRGKLQLNNNYIKNEDQESNFYMIHFFKSDNLYFFIPNSKFNKEKDNYIEDNSNNNLTHLKKNKPKIFEIIENFYLPPAYRPHINKWTNMPQCITDTCKNGSITLIKNFDKCNLIWRLIHPNKMKILIRNISSYQKYNHYPCTFYLGRKDNLYKYFKYYKRLFPEMYNYAPPTFILPNDGEAFEVEFKKSKKTIWIVKPVNLSRGRGIHLLRGESEFKDLYKRSLKLTLPQYLISKYIDKPHLLNLKKYDLRIYVLIASYTPLRIYLYQNGLVRFATENYIKGDFENVFVHLTNYSINKNNSKYKANQNLENQQCEYFMSCEDRISEIDKSELQGEEDQDRDEPDDDCNKWSLIEYKNHFKKLGQENIFDLIWQQVEHIVIKTVLSVAKQNYKDISINKMNSLFELYGFDILIDEKFRAWIMEVNVNPSLHCTSPLDLSIKTDLISDIFNVVGILPLNHNNNNQLYDISMIKNSKLNNNNDISNKKRSVSVNNHSKVCNEDEKKKNNNLMGLKSTVLRNFDPKNLRKKIDEYDDDYYKKIIEVYSEEKYRSNLTGFNLIFPLKNNIEYFGQILIKDNATNDSNIVLWEHILNE